MAKEYKPDKPKSNPLPGTATRISECTTCKEVFSSPSMFDKHLERRTCKIDSYKMVCTNPVDKGMQLNKSGFWTIPNDVDWWEKDD